MVKLRLILLAILSMTGVVVAQVQPAQLLGPGAAGPGAPPGDPFAPPSQEPTEPFEVGGDTTATHGRIPVNVVGGRLVAHCEISTIHRRIPANLFIDLESPSVFQLHNNAAGPLKVENEAGETIPITVHFPEFQVVLPRREEGPEDVFAEFTRLYSREIGEDAVVGALGAQFFKDYALVLDLPAGYVHVEPPTVDESPPEEGTLRVPVSTTDDIIWLPVTLPGDEKAAMALGTVEEDSMVDAVWSDELGHPYGDLDTLLLGDANLAERMAFRPAEINFVHEDGAFGIIGLSLLQQMRVAIDHARTRADIVFTEAPAYPKEEAAFYEALVEDDPELFMAFLQTHAEARHRQEAAERLLHAHLDSDAEPELMEQAIAWLSETWRKDIRATRALDLMKELSEAGYADAALDAGKHGVEGGREDRYPNAVHQIHARMGEILLGKEDLKQAWRHLLSAAFGLPEDGMINLHLGQCYEKQGRYQRAMSRYVQALLDAASGEQAVDALARVSRLMGEGEALTVDRIEPLIAGKTYGYSAATRYRPTEEEKAAKRVALVEFFTNAQHKHPTRDEGAIGGALGNEGVLSYFPRTHVAALAYHLPHPQLGMDSLTNEVAQAQADVYGVPPAIHIVNGVAQFPGQGKARDAEQIYKTGRDVVREALRQPATVMLELDATLEGKVLKGALVVEGVDALDARVHLVLAERGVLYPGRSKVIVHRMVARAALTRSVMGEPYQANEEGKMTLTFQRNLAEIAQGNRFYLEEIQGEGKGAVQPYATRMDPKQITLVAFVRDNDTREVLQAIQIDPVLVDAKEGESSS